MISLTAGFIRRPLPAEKEEDEGEEERAARRPFTSFLELKGELLRSSPRTNQREQTVISLFPLIDRVIFTCLDIHISEASHSGGQTDGRTDRRVTR